MPHLPCHCGGDKWYYVRGIHNMSHLPWVIVVGYLVSWDTLEIYFTISHGGQISLLPVITVRYLTMWLDILPSGTVARYSQCQTLWSNIYTHIYPYWGRLDIMGWVTHYVASWGLASLTLGRGGGMGSWLWDISGWESERGLSSVNTTNSSWIRVQCLHTSWHSPRVHKVIGEAISKDFQDTPPPPHTHTF